MTRAARQKPEYSSSSRVQIGAVGGISDSEGADPGSGDPEREGVGAWELGALVGWGPFKIGGSYQDNGDSGAPSSDGDSTGFDIGIGYSQGPILLGLNWMHSEVGVPGSGDHEQEVVTLGATYKLGKGVVVYAEGFYYDAESADVPDDDNEGLGLILGTTVKF